MFKIQIDDSKLLAFAVIVFLLFWCCFLYATDFRFPGCPIGYQTVHNYNSGIHTFVCVPNSQ